MTPDWCSSAYSTLQRDFTTMFAIKLGISSLCGVALAVLGGASARQVLF